MINYEKQIYIFKKKIDTLHKNTYLDKIGIKKN
jgi:hypothetical protein